ncbi:MAG: ABC transporter ATP-binding protein [Coriobacteriaceae bacterium]|nr:ABC transporter ATP-binding protein [Coriobacteriaceae bacterium]
MPVDETAPAVTIRGLVKRFGDVTALDGVDLRVPSGSVFGFLGPNGAGKTTTLRILTGLARPTSGEVFLFGMDAVKASAETRRIIGFLPDVPGFYGWMTAEETIRFTGRLFGLGGDALEERVRALLDLAGLSDVKTRVGGFSRGMRQRLGIAQALVNAPKLLMLDEPTSALDPMGRKDVLEMVASLAGRTTVFFSTHILSDVERVCDRVAILDKGRVVMSGPLDEITMPAGAHAFEIEVAEDAERLEQALRDLPWATSVERTGLTLSVTASDPIAAQRDVPAQVARLGLALVRFETREASLEDVFVGLVGGEGRPR